MYRVNIIDGGKQHIVKGYRYILTKRQTKKFMTWLINNELEYGDFIVEKFVYIHDGIFVWSESDATFVDDFFC